MKRNPGERWICTCGEKLIAAKTVSGAVAPITAEVKENGNVWLGRARDPEADGSHVVASAVLGGALLDLARVQGMGLHLNHFADCPDKERFRRRRG